MFKCAVWSKHISRRTIIEKEKKTKPSIPSAHTWSKWLLYMWPYTRNKRRKMVRTVSLKFLGKGTPMMYIWIYQCWHEIRQLTYPVRKDSFIVQYILCPIHQSIDIFRCGKFRRPSKFRSIFPEIFISMQIRIFSNKPYICSQMIRTEGQPTSLDTVTTEEHTAIRMKARSCTRKLDHELLEECKTLSLSHRAYSDDWRNPPLWRPIITNAAPNTGLDDAHHVRLAIRLYPRLQATVQPSLDSQTPAHAQMTTFENFFRTAIGRRNITSVASAYFRSWYCLVPSGISFRGLNVRVLPLKVAWYDILRKVMQGNLQAKEWRHLDDESSFVLVAVFEHDHDKVAK